MTIIDARRFVSNPVGNRPLGYVVGVALHHTVGTMSPGAPETAEHQVIRAIDQQHLSNGWGGFGYHYVVFPSARAYWCGWGSRAHVANRNHELIGVAVHGDLRYRRLSEYEVAAVAECIRDAWRRVGREVEVRGHRDYAVPGWGTECPGDGGIASIPDVVRAAREDDMDEATVRRIIREELGAITRDALGSPDSMVAFRALWRRLQAMGASLRDAAGPLRAGNVAGAADAIERAGRAGDPNTPPPGGY